MSSLSKASSERLVRRAIPRLKTAKSGESGGKSEQKDFKCVNATSSAADPIPKSKTVKKIQSPNDKTSSDVKGPSRQEKVTKHEDPKRKRQQSPATFEVKDHASKRNQARELHKEKTKCQIAFSSRPDTKFSGSNVQPVFTAKGPASKAKSYNLADLRRKEVELQKRVEELETQLHDIQSAKDTSTKELEIQLDKLKEDSQRLEEEKHTLEGKLEEKETYFQEAIAEQRRTLVTKNENLQQKINECQTKLLECSIDPVNLKPLTPEAEEKENLSHQAKEAANKAEILKEKLKEMMDKNKESLQDIQKIADGLQK